MAKTNNKTYREFIDESGVENIISDLKQQLQQNGQMPVWSDMIKEENGTTYQYVNYVQEGGGVLGVGLVGYTYVLEKLGVRFLKLAGTSAGAINTIMLASVDKKNYDAVHNFNLKSEIILHEMLNYDFWKLVDGKKFGKFLIKLFIDSKIGTVILKWLLLLSFIIPILYAAFFTVLVNFFEGAVYNPAIITISKILQTLTGISLIILFVAIVLFIIYFVFFSKNSYGINPGDKFKGWITDILQRNHITTANDLNKAMQQEFTGLQLRQQRKQAFDQGDTTQIDPPYITIIASDITNQTKVEFPLMAKDYWQDPSLVNPADFVRASMSIPVFFEPFIVKVNSDVKQRSTLQQQKIDVHRQELPTYDVCFVDGGILSNFPINVFHNPKVKIARFPTFGVKLEDKEHIIPGKTVKKRTRLGSFLYSIFSTVRFYYDRDFLNKNEIYERCIAHVDVSGFNWLNFGLDYNTKIELFKKGAEAAKTFFLGGTIWDDGKEKPFEPYDWEKFKKDREEMVIQQNGK